jgi:hypothetical protein
MSLIDAERVSFYPVLSLNEIHGLTEWPENGWGTVHYQEHLGGLLNSYAREAA